MGYMGSGEILTVTNLDMRNVHHKQAYYRFESEREFDTWEFLVCKNSGQEYKPLDPHSLYFCNGKVTTWDGSVRYQSAVSRPSEPS